MSKILVVVGIGTFVACIVIGSIAGTNQTASRTIWESHQQRANSQPPELFTKDRARVHYGYVTDKNQKPIEGVIVSAFDCHSITQGLNEKVPNVLASGHSPQATTTTDSDGRYEFRGLPIGLKSLSFKSDNYATRVLSNIPVRDGYGGVNNCQLSTGKSLRVKLESPIDDQYEFVVLGNQWFVDWPRGNFSDSKNEQLITGLGKAFDRGVVLVKDSQGNVVAFEFFELGPNPEYQISVNIPEPDDLPNPMSAMAEQVDRTHYPMAWNAITSQSSFDFFFALHSPLSALGLDGPNVLPENEDERNQTGGIIRGIVPTPYSPVLIEGRHGDVTVVFSDAASEYFSPPTQPGLYRVKCMAWEGKTTCWRSICLREGQESAELNFNRMHLLDFDGSEKNCQIVGVVVYNDGEPVPDASVIVQDATSFRRFLKKETTDEFGRFSFGSVPTGRHYGVLILPPDNDQKTIRDFDSISIEDNQLEYWIEPKLSKLKIELIGPLENGTNIELIRVGKNESSSVVWSGDYESHGEVDTNFLIANVSPGTYRLHLKNPKDNNAQIIEVKINADGPLITKIQSGEKEGLNIPSDD